MPYGILGFCVFLFFMSLQMQQKQVGNLPEQRTVALIGYSDATSFITYRDAIMSFQRSNPSFTGTVTYTQLQNLGYQFSADMLSKVGNAITQVAAGSGRTITVFGSLAPGSLNEILKLTDNDASFGIASGINWNSAAIGGTGAAIPLATSVPDGATVAVVQIGS